MMDALRLIRPNELASPVGAGLAILALEESGTIRTCSIAAEQLFGYPSNELAGQHVSRLLPQLTGRLMHGEYLHPRLAVLCRCANRFEAIRRDGARFAGNLFINSLGDAQERILLVIVRTAG